MYYVSVEGLVTSSGEIKDEDNTLSLYPNTLEPIHNISHDAFMYLRKKGVLSLHA